MPSPRIRSSLPQGRPAPPQGRPVPAVALLAVLCPHCNTPLARVPRVGGDDWAACLCCGRFGDYQTLSDHGALDGGVLTAQAIEVLCAELGGLRDQAVRAEATDRGD